jgi:hypothetical protein
MVVLPFGELADAIHKREGFGEVREPVLTFERTFNQGITRRELHGG